jgi:hypothetical protein
MRPLLPAQRAAEEFAGVVDGHPGDGVADRYAPLAEVVTLLRGHEQPVPRPEFVTDLRERLMLAAETELRPAAAAAPESRQSLRPRRRERHLAAAAAALVLVGGTAGVATAAQGSLPGDPLYPLKLGIEQASVALHPSDAGKGTDLLQQAGTRLAETRSLIAERAPAGQVAQSLRSFSSTAGQGADLLFRDYQSNADSQAISTVHSFATAQMAVLKGLAPRAPAGTASAFEQAANTVAGLDQQADALCAACSEGGPVAVPRDLVGPSSAASLDALIRQPAVMAAAQARLARALAAAAEAAGRSAARQPAGSTTAGPASSGPSSASQSPGSSSTAQPPAGTGTSTPVAAGGTAVKDLLDGVTQKTGGLTSGLGDATGGVSGGLDGTLGGVTGTLNGATGGGTLGDTLTGTVDGVLGGLTGGQ